MENEFVIFNAFEDDLVQIKPDLEDSFIIESKKEIHLLPYVLFKHFSPIRIKPNKDTYLAFTIPSEEPIPTYLTTIPDLADNGYLLSFYLYNISGKEIILEKGTVIGYIKVAKSLVIERDTAYYSNEYILLRELRPNIIKTFNYVIDPDGRHSLVLHLNKHFFENPFATEISLGNTNDDIDNQ